MHHMIRTTKILLTGVAAVVLAGGGVTYVAATDGGDDRLSSTDLDAATAAALSAAGGGTITDSERDGDRYEIEVRRDDGSGIDIELGRDFAVIATEPDDATDDDATDVDAPDADHRVLTDDERQRASAAALAETGGGEVLAIEVDGSGYEVDVRRTDGSHVDIDLDATFAVIHTDIDD
jgi:uncharacterized membrane protein YkoI